jgi:hypothetical protein
MVIRRVKHWRSNPAVMAVHESPANIQGPRKIAFPAIFSLSSHFSTACIRRKWRHLPVRPETRIDQRFPSIYI